MIHSQIASFSQPYVDYLNGFEDMFGPSGFVINEVTPVDSGYVVSIRGAAVPGMGWGLSVSSDTISYISISFASTGYPGPFCIDSTTSEAVPEWHANSGPNMTFKDTCYQLGHSLPNCCFVEVSSCPDELNVNGYFEPVEHDFWANWDMNTPVFTLHGPGELTGGPPNPILHYTFVPSDTDFGQAYNVRIQAQEDWCGDGSYMRQGVDCYFTLNIPGDHAPQFLIPQQQRYVAVTDETLEINLVVQDDGPLYDYTYSFFVSEQDPEPPPGSYIDELTGTFYYNGTTADTSLYWINMVVTEGADADTMGFYVYHFEDYICGDCNHSGGVDGADLGWLISSLFIDFIPPAPYESGNTDCEGEVTGADLAELIDHLFISLEPMCEGCEPEKNR